MTNHRARYGPHNPDETYIAHEFPEQLVDLGEVQMNYATLGDESSPALLLIPGQTESWWGYEAAMPRLAEHFEVFAVDLRGQGRSTRTPGRYTLDNMGNDLVRFIDTVIGRRHLRERAILRRCPHRLVVGVRQARAGGRGVVRGSTAVRVRAPAGHGPGIRQCIGPMFELWSTYLGDQWSIGAWDAMREPPQSGCRTGSRASRSGTNLPRTSRSTTPSGADIGFLNYTRQLSFTDCDGPPEQSRGVLIALRDARQYR